MKKTIKINFTDFWPSFNKKNNYFLDILAEKYNLILSESPDILFYSYFGYDYLKYNCIRILFQGENKRPNFKDCDYALSFDFMPDNKRNFRLPLYALYDDVSKLLLPKNSEEIFSEKKKFCAFVVSNKYARKRIDFFEKLSKYKKVDSGGNYLNNIGGPVKDKIAFIKDYKFTIAFENSSYPGYTTEKIFEPMLVNSIPIYWGNPYIYKDFNTKSFINCHDFSSDKAVIERIIELDSNPDLYLKMLSEPYFCNNELNEYVDIKNIMAKFEEIIESIGLITPVAQLYKPTPSVVVSMRNKLTRIKNELAYRFKM